MYLTLAFVAALSGLLTGYGMGVISGAILFIAQEFQLSPGMNGLLVGVVLIAAFFSSLISGKLGDALGAKKLLLSTAVIYVVGSLVGAFADSLAWIVVSRSLIGVAIGIISFEGPIYFSEISSAHQRGRLVSFYQLGVILGILLSFLVNFAFSANGSWQGMLGFGMVPGALLFIGMSFLPQSPRWVFLKGYEEKAREILKKVRGSGIEEELAEIKKMAKQEVKSWKTLFSKKIRPALWIGCGLSIFQQVTGINTLVYYSPTILESAGFKTTSVALMGTIGIGVVFLVSTIVYLFLIDRVGRRLLLLTGIAGMVLGLAVVIFTTNKWLKVFSLCFYIATFSISLGPIVWLMVAEIFPLKVRARGASLATAINWASNFFIAASFLIFMDLLTPNGTFALYLALSLVAWVFVYFFVPETKGVSLEKIEQHLMAGKPLRKL